MNKRTIKILKGVSVTLFVVLFLTFVVPAIFIQKIKIEDNKKPTFTTEFPVTVNPAKKTINEDQSIDAYLKESSPLQATALLSLKSFGDIFSTIAKIFAKITDGTNLALVGGEKIVTISPGLRKEEIATIFAKALGWNSADKKIFLTPKEGSDLPLKEGSFFPGTYVVNIGATPSEVQDLVNKRFIGNILSKYGTTTSETVPLETALTIASLIQRETLGTEDMRLVSGIIWNRVFSNMNLQLDATLQYAKASTKATSVWWPAVLPGDKYIKSPYNTYINPGLPPAPIANPSLAAILAALNPVKTDCLFYFHDKNGEIHCTTNYKDHVAMLKKYFGRGV